MEVQRLSEQEVKKRLSQVKYPGYSRDIVSFGMLKGIHVEGPDVRVSLQISSKDAGIREKVVDQAKAAVAAIPGVARVTVELGQEGVEAASKPDAGKAPIAGVENTIAVASGKGGVGKSTVSVNLALALAQNGSRVGILDADIYGPSIPLMLGISETPRVTPDRHLVPVDRYQLQVMSVGFLVDDTTPVIWRGPLVMQMVKQFLHGVAWRNLDFLVVDLPPGTGDAQLTLVQSVPINGAVIVTTPQDVALLDAKKAVKMFEKVNVPVFGIVENMSYFLCPHCEHRTEIFSHGGGEEASKLLSVPFLGEIPLDVAIRAGGDQGRPIVLAEPESAQAELFRRISKQVVARIASAKKAASPG